MADDTNEDSWLYGTSNPDSTTNGEEKQTESESTLTLFEDKPDENLDTEKKNDVSENEEPDGHQSPDSNQRDDENKVEQVLSSGIEEDDPAQEMEEQEDKQDKVDEDEMDEDEDKNKETGDIDDDESDDDINVVIGDIKSGPSYNIKQRPNLLASTNTNAQDKIKQSAGKFNIEEFESVGTINGVPAHEFSIDSLDEKPWRKPGADITDYFNYGFNEDTWRAYCERQKRIRINDSGVGLQGLTPANNTMPPPTVNNRTLTPLVNNENSKYSNNINPIRKISNFPRKYDYDKQENMGMKGPLNCPAPPAKENVIQVMTAECREYSRTGMNPNNFGNPGNDQYFDGPDSYNYGYEPTQDSQWMPDNSNWTPSGIKELTPGPPPPQMVPPPMGPMHHGPPPPGPMGGPPMRPPMVPSPMGMPPPSHMNMGMMPPRMMHPNDREREKIERDRERERERDRERERSGRERERDRERDDRDRERERDWDRNERERERERDRDRDRERDRERERSHDRTERSRDRGKSEESERNGGVESPSRDRDRRRVADRHRDRDRERSSRRERSRSREKSRRRSRSRDRDRDRKSRDKKKSSHRKEKDESE